MKTSKPWTKLILLATLFMMSVVHVTLAHADEPADEADSTDGMRFEQNYAGKIRSLESYNVTFVTDEEMQKEQAQQEQTDRAKDGMKVTLIKSHKRG